MATSDNERYFRYILLLAKGGPLALKCIITREIANAGGNTLNQILQHKKVYLGKVTKIKEQYMKLFPDNRSINDDVDTWDISLLCHVLLNVFKLDSQDKVDIRAIRDFRNEIQAHSITLSLDENEFNSLRMDLNDVLIGLAKRHADTSTNIQIQELIKECTTGSIEISSTFEDFKEFQKQLLMQIKCDFSATHIKLDWLCEEMKQLKEKRSEFTEADLQILCNVKQEQDDCKRLIKALMKKVGSSDSDEVQEDVEARMRVRSETTKLASDAEDILVQKINELLDEIRRATVPNQVDEQVIRQHIKDYLNKTPSNLDHKELSNALLDLILDILRTPGTSVLSAKKACVRIYIRCKTFESILNFIEYIGSKMFQDHIRNIEYILRRITGHACFLTTDIPSEIINTLVEKHVNNNIEIQSPETLLFVRCKSIYGIEHVWNLFQEGMADHHLRKISTVLSKIVGGRTILTSYIKSHTFKEVLRSAEQMMAHSADLEEEKLRRVMHRAIGRLEKNMIPDSIIDHSTGFQLFSFKDRRNIKQKENKTEKNHAILAKVKTKDGYLDFKKRLKETRQDELVEYLDCVEKELDTSVIEKKIDVKAEQTSVDQDYYKAKKELKEKLIKFYKEQRSTVPLSPLVEEKDTPLAGFYVMPDIALVKQTSITSDQEERTQVNSLKDLLITGGRNQSKIFLSADAGCGKTSFSKYLAITWAQAFSPDENQGYFIKDELKTLANFEFLFLVLLRHSTGVCRIDKMIEQETIMSFNRSASQCLLQDILEREKCLIIMDGLDEWIHPQECFNQNEIMPHQNTCGPKCSILTTSRPWKFGVNLKTTEKDKRVELVQGNKYFRSQLQKNFIRKISAVTDDHDLEEKNRDFTNDVVSRGLDQMNTIPLLLMYITCLWCNKIPIGNSKAEVYTNIVEFLLSRAAQKDPNVHQSSGHLYSIIPDYFKNCKFCTEFYPLLLALADLAYHALFNEKRENTLVFDRSVAGKYLEAHDMKLSFLSGILTECSTTTVTERTTKVSFSHKTVQEFLAAVFISSLSDGQKTVEEKCKNVQSIQDMSMTWEFLSKMNSKMMSEISEVFVSVINEDEETSRYRTMTGYEYSAQLYNIQNMLRSCLKESENIRLCLQDFYIDCDEAIQDKHLQRLIKFNKTNIKSLYFIDRGTSSSLREIIELFSPTDLKHLQKLHCYSNTNKADLGLLLFPSLQNIHLTRTIWTNYEQNLNQKLEILKNVKYLGIDYVKLSHESLVIFCNFITDNKAMEELSLRQLLCEEHWRDCKINLDLSKKTRLKNVDLANISLDERSLLLSSDMLNIERVKLVDIEIYPESLENLVKNLEEIPHTVTVQMYRIKGETSLENVRNYIRRSHDFVVTRDDGGDWRECKFAFQTNKLSKE